MKKGLLLVASTLVLGGLVGCGGNKGNGGNEGNKPNPDIPEKGGMFDNFKSALDTTLTATYTSNYRLDVETENVGAKGFERQVDDTVTVDADFTAGNLYLYTKRVGREFEKEDKTTYETLLFKDGDSYKFLTSTMEDAITIPTEEKALEKIDYLLKKSSTRNGGKLDARAFLYETDKAYEHHHFLLDSTNIPLEAFNDEVTYTETAEGITATTSLSAVGYGTDQGISELSADPAATVTTKMTKEGFVTSYTETFNDPSMKMPIFSPAPILHLSGARSLDADYGVELTRKTTIDHKAVYGTVSLGNVKGATVKLYNAAPEHLDSKVEIQPGDQILADNWLVVELTLTNATGVVSVMNNNNGATVIEPTENGKTYTYVFEAAAGENSIVISLDGVKADVAKVTMPAMEDVKKYFDPKKVSLVSFIFEGGKAKDIKVAKGEIEIKPNAWGAFRVLEGGFKEGFTKDNVEVYQNDSKTMAIEIEGVTYYSWSIKDEVRQHTLTIKKAEEQKPVEGTIANINIAPNAGVTEIQVTSMDIEGQQPTNFKPITDGKAEIGPNKWIGLKITVAEGKEIESVKANGTETQVFAGQYCFQIKTAGDYNVTIKLVGDVEVAELVYEANANVQEIVATSMILEGQNASDFKPVVDNKAEIGEKKWIGLKVTAVEGKEVEAVKVNGKGTQFIAGQYCFPISVAGQYKVEVVIKGFANIVVKDNADVKVAVLFAMDLEGQNPANMHAVANNNEAVSDIKWVAVRVNCVDGKQVKAATVNGQATQFIAGQYCFPIKTAGTYNVELTTEVRTTAKVAITNDATATLVCQTMVIVGQGAPSEMTPVELKGNNAVFAVKENLWFAIAVTCPDGKEVESVKVNNEDAKFFAGNYCFKTEVAKDYRVTITLKDAAK